MSHEHEGTLVALESLDGGGKSTLVSALGQKFDSLTTKEPTDFWTGDTVYRSLKDDDASALQDFFLFLADRANHVQQRVGPALERGELVITDRYSDSTRAYQTHRIAEQTDMDWTEAFWWMTEMFEPWNIEPDAVLYLDISVDTAVERCGAEDKYEKRANLQKVKKAYDVLAEGNHLYRDDTEWIEIDGEQPPSDVEEHATAALRSLLS